MEKVPIPLLIVSPSKLLQTRAMFNFWPFCVISSWSNQPFLDQKQLQNVLRIPRSEIEDRFSGGDNFRNTLSTVSSYSSGFKAIALFNVENIHGGFSLDAYVAFSYSARKLLSSNSTSEIVDLAETVWENDPKKNYSHCSAMATVKRMHRIKNEYLLVSISNIECWK